VSPRRPHRRSLLLWRLRRRPVLWWSLAALAVVTATFGAQGALGAGARSCPQAPAAPVGTADGTVAASLPGGTRAVAVPVSGALPVTVGDEVDLVAPGAPLVEGGAGEVEAATVAEAALVVQVAPEAITVAVDQREAADAAVAVAQGGTTLLLRGTG
jgi:hypothetical protein